MFQLPAKSDLRTQDIRFLVQKLKGKISLNTLSFQSFFNPYLCSLMQKLELFTQAVREALPEPKNIVITNHINPDGDAVGSALALAALLQSEGHQVQVIMPNDYAANLKWLEGSDQVFIFARQQAQSEQTLAMADVIFHLDYNSLKRSGPMQEALEKASATKFVIDHHQQPEGFADALYSDTTMSSTCEMIYHFTVAMGWQSKVSLAVAEAIYLGLVTDTGNFRFASTTSATHQAAAFLLEKGVNPGTLTSRIYDSNPPARLRLLSRMLNRMEVQEELSAVILSLEAKDFEELGYEKGILEGFVNYGLSLQGIEISVLAYPGAEGVKMSFRSKTTFDVNTFARTYFNGGGHTNAAGALSPYKTLEETLSHLRKHLKDHQDEIPS